MLESTLLDGVLSFLAYLRVASQVVSDTTTCCPLLSETEEEPETVGCLVNIRKIHFGELEHEEIGSPVDFFGTQLVLQTESHPGKRSS